MEERVEVALEGDKVVFKIGGEAVAGIILYWGGSLEAGFQGSRENAERLAEILRALGARVEARPCGREWCVSMGADQIAEIRHEGWVAAVAEFLRRKAAEAKDEEERRKIERVLDKVERGVNRIWLYGVPLRVSYRFDINALVIRYSPEREEELRRAYEALRGRLGEYVTAGRRHVALKIPEALRELARRAAEGDREAERFLGELRRYAEAYDKARGLAGRGLSKKLEELLKPSAAEERLEVDVGGVKAVVKVRAEVGVGTGAGFAPAADYRGPECRLRVTVEYSVAGGGAKAWRVTFSWQRTSKGIYTPQAAAKGYDAVEARILAKVFEDDRFLKQARVTLTARHLEALLRFKEAAEAVERWLKTRPSGGASRHSGEAA